MVSAMPDREKTLNGVLCCMRPNDHEHCPYNGADHYNTCTYRLLEDVATLLRQCCDTCEYRMGWQHELDEWDVCAKLDFRPVAPDFYCGYWKEKAT